MDWIDPKTTEYAGDDTAKPSKTHRSVNLQKQVSAVLAQPIDVWATGFEHSLANVQWPAGCDVQTTLQWSAVIAEQTEVLHGLFDEPIEDKLFDWLKQSDAYPHAALGVLVAVWSIPKHARSIDAAVLSKWVRDLATEVVERRQEQSDCLLGNLVFHCELPLLLNLLSASPRHAGGDVASRAMDDLAEYLENSEEHVESWLAHGATYLRASLGSVLRCRVLADHLGLRRWYSPQRKALGSLLEHARRWSRPDGSPLLGNATKRKASAAIWKALRSYASERKSPPESSYHSDGAQCALMRRSSKHPGCALAIDFSEANVQLEALGSKGVSLIRGEWPVQVALDGQVQYQMDGWDPVCWFSDSDIDYLEIETRFGELARVQRQLILFRKQRFLLAADALLSERRGNWSIISELPLASDVEFESTPKNTEAYLVSGPSRALVVPLFLPEWKSSPSTGSLNCESGRLILRNATHGGSSVYSPALISLSNRTAKQPFTWRLLTVAENLMIAPRDQAVAFRFQSGKKQFLIYRNLAQVTKRTTLGIHLLCDFFAGLFDKDTGEASTLIEIDPA